MVLGKTAYADQLEPIRAVLLANDTTPSPDWSVEHRIDRRGCAPEHCLVLKETAPVVVHVQLFRERVWWVKLAKIGLREKPPLAYGIDIARGEEFSW